MFVKIHEFRLSWILLKILKTLNVKGYVTEEGESIPDEFKENRSGRLIN